MRRAFTFAGDHAAHLRKLVHQVRLCVQAAGGVDDDDVASLPVGRLDRVVRHRRGVCAAVRADERRRRAIGPDLELLLRRSAERVSRSQHDGVTVLTKPLGELADRRRLSRPVDADDEEHARTVVHGQRPGIPEQVRDLVGERLVQVSEVAARLEPADQLGGRPHADVRADERLLEPLPGELVGGVERGRLDLLGQRAP